MNLIGLCDRGNELSSLSDDLVTFPFHAKLNDIGPTITEGFCQITVVTLPAIGLVNESVKPALIEWLQGVEWLGGEEMRSTANFDQFATTTAEKTGNEMGRVNASTKIRILKNSLLKGDGGLDASDHEFG